MQTQCRSNWRNIKAAGYTKVLLASSRSVIFRSIVRYLSIEKIKNLSSDNKRKSNYHIEQVDKEIAIATLGKLILQIREY